MPVGIFSSLRNKSSGQVLHSQTLNLSFSVTSLTGSLNFSAFSLLNLRIPSPALPGVYLFLTGAQKDPQPQGPSSEEHFQKALTLLSPSAFHPPIPWLFPGKSMAFQSRESQGMQLSQVFALQSLTNIRKDHSEICWP